MQLHLVKDEHSGFQLLESASTYHMELEQKQTFSLNTIAVVSSARASGLPGPGSGAVPAGTTQPRFTGDGHPKPAEKGGHPRPGKGAPPVGGHQPRFRGSGRPTEAQPVKAPSWAQVVAGRPGLAAALPDGRKVVPITTTTTVLTGPDLPQVTSGFIPGVASAQPGEMRDTPPAAVAAPAYDLPASAKEFVPRPGFTIGKLAMPVQPPPPEKQRPPRDAERKERTQTPEHQKAGRKKRSVEPRPATAQAAPPPDPNPGEAAGDDGWKKPPARRTTRVVYLRIKPLTVSPDMPDDMSDSYLASRAKGAVKVSGKVPQAPGASAPQQGLFQQRSNSSASGSKMRMAAWLNELPLAAMLKWYLAHRDQDEISGVVPRDMLKLAYEKDVATGTAGKAAAVVRLRARAEIEHWEWRDIDNTLAMLDAVVARGGEAEAVIQAGTQQMPLWEHYDPDDVQEWLRGSMLAELPEYIHIEHGDYPIEDLSEEMQESYRQYLAMTHSRAMHALNGNINNDIPSHFVLADPVHVPYSPYLGPGRFGTVFETPMYQIPNGSLEALAKDHDNLFVDDRVRADQEFIARAKHLGPVGQLSAAAITLRAFLDNAVSSKSDGYMVYKQATNSKSAHVYIGNTTQQRFESAIALAAAYCQKSQVPTRAMEEGKTVHSVAQDVVYVHNNPNRSAIPPTVGRTFVLSAVRDNSIIGADIPVDTVRRSWVHRPIVGKGPQLSVTALGTEVELAVGNGVFNKLRTNNAVVNTPAISDILGQALDASNQFNAYQSQSGSVADIPTKLFLMLATNMENVPYNDNIPWEYTSAQAIPGTVAQYGNVAWPMSPNPVGGGAFNLSAMYIGLDQYAQLIRQNNQNTGPVAVPDAFRYPTWDATTAVIFVNGNRMSGHANGLWALAHMEYPFFETIWDADLWDTHTVNKPGASFAGPYEQRRVSGSHRWEGPRTNALFVEVEQGFPNTQTTFGIGGQNLVLNAAPVNIPFVALQPYVANINYTVVNEVLDWWVQTGGTDEEMALAKYWYSTCIKSYSWSPQCYKDSGGGFFTNGVVAGDSDVNNYDLPPPTAGNIAAILDNSDHFSPLAIPNVSQVSAARIPQLAYYQSGAVVRGLLALGLMTRGSPNHSKWVWGYSDMCDALRVADLSMVACDALIETRGLHPIQLKSIGSASYENTAMKKFLPEFYALMDTLFVGTNLTTYPGSYALETIGRGVVAIHNLVYRYSLRVPTIVMQSLGIGGEENQIVNELIYYSRGKVGSTKGLESVEFSLGAPNNQSCRFVANDFITNPPLFIWTGWQHYQNYLDTAQSSPAVINGTAVVGYIGHNIVPRYVESSAYQVSPAYVDSWSAMQGVTPPRASTSRICTTGIVTDGLSDVAAYTPRFTFSDQLSALVSGSGAFITAIATSGADTLLYYRDTQVDSAIAALPDVLGSMMAKVKAPKPGTTGTAPAVASPPVPRLDEPPGPFQAEGQ